MDCSVTVHHKALSDRRIVLLAKLLGVDADSALGKMTRLWSVMTRLQTDTPDVDHVRACLLSEVGEDLLVRSGLGERLQDGAVRVRGRVDETGKDRLEWYAELTNRQIQAGRARAETAPRDRRGRLLPGSVQPEPACPASDPKEDPLSGSGSPSSGASGSDPRGDRDQEPTEAEIAEAEGLVLPPFPPLHDVNRSPEVPHTAELDSSLERVKQTKAIGRRVWERLRDLRRTIATELKLDDVRDIDEQDIGTRALTMRIRAAIAEGTDLARIEGDLNHVVDVVAAEARVTKSVRWLSTGVFEDRAYRTALAMTLADAQKPRSNTNNRPGPKPEQPARKIPTL